MMKYKRIEIKIQTNSNKFKQIQTNSNEFKRFKILKLLNIVKYIIMMKFIIIYIKYRYQSD